MPPYDSVISRITPVPLRQQLLAHFFLLLGLNFLHLAGQRVSLGLDTFLSSLTGSLGLGTFGIHFILEDALTLLLGLGLVDMFNQRTLVLEGITFAQVVELVVEVLINLASSAVLNK